jgi:hypothetical protein
MAKQIDITDPKIVKAHVSAMVASTGYQIVLQYLNIAREKIIEEGKAARSEERQIRNWARLAGYDEVVATINKLANLQIDEEQADVSED